MTWICCKAGSPSSRIYASSWLYFVCFQNDVKSYCLQIAEDDGEVDTDFPGMYMYTAGVMQDIGLQWCKINEWWKSGHKQVGHLVRNTQQRIRWLQFTRQPGGQSDLVWRYSGSRWMQLKKLRFKTQRLSTLIDASSWKTPLLSFS